MTFAQLRQNISNRFSTEEIRTLCFDLEIDFDALPGEGKDAKVRELIALCQRQDQLPQLITTLQQYRPNNGWQVPKPSLNDKLDSFPIQPSWLLLGATLLALTIFAGILIDKRLSDSSNPPIEETSTATTSIAESSATPEPQIAIPTTTSEPTKTATPVITNQPTSDGADNDGDGLSNQRELEIGTDPNVADTDKDGLTDGEEVNQYGTIPLKQDSDNDILIDWEEVNVYGTSPTNPDTDNDGQPDGIEVNLGRNPLGSEPITQTPTPNSVSSPEPTATATQLPLASTSENPNGVRVGIVNGNTEIFVIYPSGKEVNITNHPSNDGSPNLSPDGKLVYFASDRDGPSHIFLMNSDGTGNITRLSLNSSYSDNGPSLSPNGQKIVFHTSREGKREIYVMNIDGSNPSNLSRSPETYDTEPYWSFDGNQIFFKRGPERETAVNCYVMNSDGSNIRPCP